MDPQTTHHLLRKCLDSCKVNHILRSTDTYQFDSFLHDAEVAILEGFEEVLGASLPPAQRVQASLPLSAGGCGLRCPLQVRPAARMAALVSFLCDGAERVGIPDLARQHIWTWFHPVLTELQGRLGQHDPLPSWCADNRRILQATAEHKRQKWWTAALGRKRMEELLDSVPKRDQARILEQQGGVGTAFMSVPPSIPLRTFLPPEQYRLGLRWWLGLPLIPTDLDSPVQCPGCGQPADTFGDHVICCQHNDFTQRHRAVVTALHSALVSSGQGVALEQRVPGAVADLRPADLLLLRCSEGKDVAIDVTVRHGWAKSEHHPDSQERVARERWRSFLCRQETRKHEKYDDVCEDAGWAFKAFAMGTWGGLGPEAAYVLRRISQRTGGWFEGSLRAARAEEVRLQVGLALMRGILDLLYHKNYLV